MTTINTNNNYQNPQQPSTPTATDNHQNPRQQLKPFATIKHPLQPSTHGNPKLPTDLYRQPTVHNRPIKPTSVKLRHPNPSIATNRKTQTIEEPTIKPITVDHPNVKPTHRNPRR
jgi:hypothetical protein